MLDSVLGLEAEMEAEALVIEVQIRKFPQWLPNLEQKIALLEEEVTSIN